MGFKDPSGAARLAIIAVVSYAAIGLVAFLVAFMTPADPYEMRIADFLLLFYFLVLLATMIVVARWIYRTNANAHAFGQPMTITPGWSIGWYFVPFANLVKPYQGMKETWEASHLAAGLPHEMETPLIGWWWALWLGTNIASTASAQIVGLNPEVPQEILLFDLIISVVNIALCWVLVQLIQRLTRAQLTAQHGHVFA